MNSQETIVGQVSQPARLRKLRETLAREGLDGLLVSQAENRRYLSGFTGSAGVLLVSAEQAILATDSRYTEQAAMQAPDFRVHRIEGELPQWFPGLAAEWGARKVGFESPDLSYAAWKRLIEAIAGSRIELSPTQGLVEALRVVKVPDELVYLEKAAALADAAMAHARKLARPGMTELELAWIIESFMREHGSEAVPFPPIVAFGPSAALPHHEPDSRPLAPGEPVLLDIGARVGGYSSDLTRTFCLGDPTETFRKVYDLVLGAQLTALSLIKPGMTGEEADRLARTVIEAGGRGDSFGHGLGHGVGLAIHEDPRLGRGSQAVLAEGNVVTVEPGVYLPGWGGVRVEDMVVLESKGVRALSRAPKSDRLEG